MVMDPGHDLLDSLGLLIAGRRVDEVYEVLTVLAAAHMARLADDRGEFIERDSLEARWAGFIWMNPPFGPRNGIAPWLDKFFKHGDGIALTPDRTSAPWWQEFAPRSDLILFVSPKIKFVGADGQPGTSPAQGTSLMAIGVRGREALYRAAGAHLGVLLEAK